jgi:Zn-dependent M16 (insulinase) family peptidase
MNVIDYYLLGNAASPLRKALIDSKLGEELTDSGYASFQRDTFFTVGLKGTEAEHTDEIVNLIMTTCTRLAQEGLEKSKVEAAFHRLELSSREIQGHYPLHLMDRVYRSWIYDADPLYHLRLNEHLVELRSHFETEDRFFERQLAEMIVENPHRSVLTFVPERDYVAKRDEAFRSKMEAMKRNIGEADLRRILREAEALNIMQSTPNSPEALATLPRLSLSDVPKEPQYLQTTIEEIVGVPFLHTDIFSNGVNYLNLAFDLRGIDDALIEYLPLYAEALRKMGAGDDDYVVMAEREAASTGGVNTGLSANGRIDDPIYVQPFLFVSSNSLDAKVPEMLEITAQRIMKCDLTDMERLKDVVLQARVGVRSQIIPNGSNYALGHAGRNLSRNAFLSERMGGVTHVRLLDSLIEDFDAVKKDLKGKLERIRDFILAKGRLTVSFVGGDDQLRMVRAFLADFLVKLGDELPPEEASEFSPRMSTREAIATPADVAFVAAAFPVVGAAHEEAPALLLLSTHLSYGYLWDQIRVKRGAYGARAVYDPLNGLFGFSSYRDPFIRETLQAYQGVFDYVTNEMDLSPPAVEKAIIGTIKTLDRPIRPGQAVGLALLRYLKGETEDFRRAFRARLMSLTGDELRRVCLNRLKPGFNTAPICVLSSREKLTAANETLTPDTLAIVDL